LGWVGGLIAPMPKICTHELSDSSTICTNHANACCRNELKFRAIVKRALDSPHYGHLSAALSIERERAAHAHGVRSAQVRLNPRPVQSAQPPVQPITPPHARRPTKTPTSQRPGE
jgi:hypothetical protein